MPVTTGDRTGVVERRPAKQRVKMTPVEEGVGVQLGTQTVSVGTYDF